MTAGDRRREWGGRAGDLLRFLTTAVWRALLSGGEPGQGGLFAEVLAQAPDVFDRHEDAMTFGIVELKVLGGGAIGCLEQPGSRVSAEAMRGMEHQLTGIEGGSELRCQVLLVYPPVGPL
jgi:hypothetical protein